MRTNAFQEPRSMMTILTNLEVIGMLGIFKSVLKMKANNTFCLIGKEFNFSGPLNIGGMANLPLLGTLLVTALSFVLLAYYLLL